MGDQWRIYCNSHKVGERPAKWEADSPYWLALDPAKLPKYHDGMNFQPVDPATPEPPQGFYYVASEKVINTVNLAIRLRRPILVTGVPGIGKTTLASSIAYELGLGPVLQWLITSRSTVHEGLYQYDALSRVSDMNFADKADDDKLRENASDIGRYITLGPLGDALLPRPVPRVLLIDEIDKCDIDLPGDLLHVLEQGIYQIPELVRDSQQHVRVQRAETDSPVWIEHGRVNCYEFPIVVITSNEDRDLPPAFQRRCLRIRLDVPDAKTLEEIAARKLGVTIEELQAAAGGRAAQLIKKFADEHDPDGRGPDGGKRATSQLFNALYLRLNGDLTEEHFAALATIVLEPLTE